MFYAGIAAHVKLTTIWIVESNQRRLRNRRHLLFAVPLIQLVAIEVQFAAASNSRSPSQID